MKLRKVLYGNIGDEVLEKYKVEVSSKRQKKEGSRRGWK